ncbi:MAG: GSCFA domain-containing protein [Bacteroidales bacterium]|nr:GSCFA domain-containing protein [Bacteroidales bacterium]
MTPPLTTPVVTPPMPFSLDHSSLILSLGSCFADEIGRRLLDGGFCVELNPFGTLYNPASIASALDRLLTDTPIAASDLVQHESLWHSWHHHGSFSRPTAEACLAACNERLHQAHLALQQATLLTLTFGTAWVFSLREETSPRSSRVVANCHKLPASHFERWRLDTEDICDLWLPLLQRLHDFNPKLKVLFTVSPIRHLADGAHGNQLSKATLLLAVEKLCTAHPTLCTYFPAYEIVLDELRDYRFFAPDMTHPSSLAADIVYSRFQQSCLSPALIQQAHLAAKAHRREQHRPLH